MLLGSHQIATVSVEKHFRTLLNSDKVEAALCGIPQNGLQPVISGDNYEAFRLTIKHITNFQA